MRRLFKILVYLVILVAVLLGGAALAWLYAPSDMIERLAESQVEEATGRKLTIDGDIERRLFPVLGVKLSKVTLANADWADSGPLATADSADVGVRFLPLLTGALEIERIEIERPVVTIEIAEDGRRSWEMEGFDVDSGAAADFEERTGLPEPSDIGEGGGGDDVVVVFERFAITDGAVTVVDNRPGGAPVTITDIQLEGALPSLDETLTLTGSAVAQGRPARLGLTLESPAALSRGELATAKADLSAEGVTFDFDGDFRGGGAAPEAEGALALTLDADKERTAWLRALLPEALDPLGGVDVNGSFKAAEAGVDASLRGDIGFRERATTFTAAATSGEGWASGAAPVTLDLDASNGLFTAAWDGAIAAKAGGGTIAGDLSFASDALREFFVWLGLGPIDAPAGAFERLDVSARLDAAPEQGALTDLDVTLDDSAVTGEMSYDLTGERPAVAATLRSGPLDIRPFVELANQGGGAGASGGAGGSGGSGGGDGSGGSGWSKEPLDLGALQLVDANIDVLTEGLTTPVIKLDRTHVVAVLEDGRLQTDVKEMALYGGDASGQAVIDGSGAAPSMTMAFDATGVALRPLLRDGAEMDWLEGAGAMNIDVRTQGESLDAMMRALDGAAAIDFRDGAIIGFNLAALARNVTTLGLGGGGEQKTDFAEMTASFQIEDGVAANEDFFLAGPLVRLTGKGVVDIGNQTLNYRAVPRAVASLAGQGGSRDNSGIAFPLLITGPWSDPSITPDLAGGAIESLEGLLEDPGAVLDQLGGDGVGELLEGGDIGEALEGLTGGGEGGGGLGDALEGLTGGGDDEGGSGNPLRGLF